MQEFGLIKIFTCKPLFEGLFCQFFPEHTGPCYWSLPWTPVRGCSRSAACNGHNLTLVEADDRGFPCGSLGEESACNSGDPDLIPGLGRFPGEGNGNPLQYSCLENAMDRGAWRVTVHGVTESNMTVWLTFIFTLTEADDNCQFPVGRAPSGS